MSHALSLINAFAAPWANALLRACWQGGLGSALVWLLCHLWPALPANPRCWLWRLAYTKLLLGLVWLPPLALPLLPAPKQPAPTPVVQATTPPVLTLPDDTPLTAVGPAPPPSATLPVLLAAPVTPPTTSATPPAAVPLPPPRPTLPTPQTWLLAVWILGVLASLGRVASAWGRACTLSRTSRPLADDALQADAADLSRRLGLRRVPPLRVADGLASPLLLGMGRPAILLPAFVVSGSPRPELRLMLAHELAHLARRDLWWNALPLLAQRLFFFHPLVWLAGHEWALTQEIACDALAVETTGTPPSAYGRMLLGIATRRPSAAPLFPTLAVAAPRHTLRRRLHAMQHIGTVSRPRLILAAALTALLAVGGLLPWRVVAQSGAAVSSTLPAAMRAMEARQEKERANYAAWEAQADAQFAEALRHVPPARQKEVQASIASMDAYVAKSQEHTLMMEQHRANYVATHPYKLSNAQRNDIIRLLDLNVRRNGLNQSVAMGRILRVKLLADVAAAKDTVSKESYQAQIERDDSRRRAAEQEMRLLEPRIARQKAVVALIPQDQRTLMDKLRHYDIDIWCGRIEALTIKRSRMQVLQQLLAAKPPRQHQGTTIKASFAPPEARTASFNAVAVGGLPALRLVQSVAAASVPTGVTQTQDMWQEEERKEQADFALRNAKSDAQLAEVQKNLSPAQLTKVQPEIDRINADYAKEQQSVQALEKSRADYVATHPNRLTDAQITEVEQLKRQISEPDKIRYGINQRLVIVEALKARIAATHDAGLRGGWGREIKAIDRRQREDERRIRELAPDIARQEAKLAAFPADQRERLARLHRYTFEIIVGRMQAYEQKRVNVFQLYVEYVTSKQRHASDASARWRSGGATTGAASVQPHASIAPSNALAVGGIPPLRLAQSVVAPPPVPAGVAHTEAKWEELERKQHADIDSRNAQADAQLADIQKHLPPAQLKAVQSQIAFANAEYAKEQKRVQISEQSRAAYIASHPNRLSDAQIAFVQKVNWEKMHPSRIDEGIRWEQTIERKLRTHLEAAHDARSRQGWQRQITAIEQRRREGEAQMRELAPVIARQQAELAAIPKDQRDRVAMLRSYGLEISCGRMEALVEKQVWVQVLRQRIAGKERRPVQH